MPTMCRSAIATSYERATPVRRSNGNRLLARLGGAPAADLVENAKLAEEAGFGHALISDHIHPWVDAQGHSPFVWGVIGAIAEATQRSTSARP